MNEDLLRGLHWAALQFIVLVLCVALHEFGHAWTADRRGDPLPRAQGRVTLNPLAHADPLGTFLIPGLMIFLPALFGSFPVALIGWGKPVQISLPNAKTRRASDILITLSGPAMNLLLALFGAVLLGIAFGASGTLHLPPATFPFLAMFVGMNAGLAIFNLIPLPPLDGSRVLRHAVGMSEETFAKIARNAWWILLLALNLPPGNPIFLAVFGPLVRGAATAFFFLSEKIAGLF